MPNDKFYSSRPWRKLRAYKLSVNPFCQKMECVNLATEVHHIKDRADFPDLELCFDNLQSLCKTCHSTHTATNIKREWKPLKLRFE
jgi:5-methylcytosine-specific restriction enzyme A